MSSRKINRAGIQLFHCHSCCSSGSRYVRWVDTSPKTLQVWDPSNILKSNCSMFFLFQKCVSQVLFQDILGPRLFHDIYKKWNKIIPCHSFCSSGSRNVHWTGTFLKIIGQIAFHDINQIVPCYGYCSSDSRNLWLLDTFP